VWIGSLANSSAVRIIANSNCLQESLKLTNTRGITLNELIFLLLLLGVGSVFYIAYTEVQQRITRAKALDQIIEFVLQNDEKRSIILPKDKST
jgi:hypothetical protein